MAILGYKPSSEAKKLLANSKLLLLVGPTGSGEDTLEKRLLKTGSFKPIVTHTTRPPRENNGVLENDGDEYHFVTTALALNMLKEHKFVEAAYTHKYLYGTSIKEFEAAKREGKIAVADIDIKGVRSYRNLTAGVIAVFLLPPSFKVLIERLIKRYGKSHDQEDIKLRLATALDELSELLNTDYYHPIINNNIETTLNNVIDIARGVEKIKTDPKPLNLAKKLINEIQEYLVS